MTAPGISTRERNTIKENLNRGYLDEEIYWKQKSMTMWLLSDDRNNTYFHGITQGKRNRKTITAIQDENEVVGRGHKDIASVAESYFRKLLTSEQVDQRHQRQYDDIFQGFQGRVTPAMNQDFTGKITEEEVRTALFQMNPNKVPGLMDLLLFSIKNSGRTLKTI